MEPVRVRGGSARRPLAIGVMVLAGVVAIAAAPQFLGPGASSPAVPPLATPQQGTDPSDGGAFSVIRVASPAASTGTLQPSYPPTADRSSEFWVEIRRQGRVLRHVPLVRRSDGSQTGTIPIPVAWRTRPPIVTLFGRTVPADPASRLFSIRLALPDTPRLGPALNLAGGLSVVVDPIPGGNASFRPPPMLAYIHSWSYSANLQWAIAGGPELVVTVAPQAGVY